jgi:hypothetical protein
MRLAIVVCVAALLVTGCAAEPRAAVPSAPETTATATSVESSIGADVPPDDPSAARADKVGQTPDQVVLALIDATVRHDWRTMYSLYAEPDSDFETVRREAIVSNQTYADFRALEVRVLSDGTARVRVAYRGTTTPPAGAAYEVVVAEPGEWWAIFKVDGLWKVQWLPRQ